MTAVQPSIFVKKLGCIGVSGTISNPLSTDLDAGRFDVTSSGTVTSATLTPSGALSVTGALTKPASSEAIALTGHLTYSNVYHAKIVAAAASTLTGQSFTQVALATVEFDNSPGQTMTGTASRLTAPRTGWYELTLAYDAEPQAYTQAWTRLIYREDRTGSWTTPSTFGSRTTEYHFNDGTAVGTFDGPRQLTALIFLEQDWDIGMFVQVGEAAPGTVATTGAEETNFMELRYISEQIETG